MPQGQGVLRGVSLQVEGSAGSTDCAQLGPGGASRGWLASGAVPSGAGWLICMKRTGSGLGGGWFVRSSMRNRSEVTRSQRSSSMAFNSAKASRLYSFQHRYKGVEAMAELLNPPTPSEDI